jgi:hypothetical protein
VQLIKKCSSTLVFFGIKSWPGVNFMNLHFGRKAFWTNFALYNFGHTYK